MIELVESDGDGLVSDIALRLLHVHAHFDVDCRDSVVDGGGRGVGVRIEVAIAVGVGVVWMGGGAVGRDGERVVHGIRVTVTARRDSVERGNRERRLDFHALSLCRSGQVM